ncbi:tRNA lysidine(34) synthetase TilS [Nibrella viscosa]|uniref:tRNA(Ile)-lysidine synthase n=2 Tax=Nibrella viscosa TaxID=1084524 RepID=A0ABP8KDR3_9BACT
MAHIFHRVGQPFAIAHVNFGLRGADSDDDARFVENIADRYRVPFHQARFETALVAKNRKISVQMAARDLRYAWFEQVLDSFGYTGVATAHHQNDVLETLLINLVRGTGLAGLQGIPVRQGRVIRPLWFANRTQLLDYVQEHTLTWREDSSNAEDKYLRNRLRHHVLPVLQALNPALLTDTLPETVERLGAAGRLLREVLAQRRQTVVVEQAGRLLFDVRQLVNLTEPQFCLQEWLRPYGFTSDQIRQIWMAVSREPGQTFRSATHRLLHDRDGLVLMPLAADNAWHIQLDEWPQGDVVMGVLRLRFKTFDKPDGYQVPTDPAIACLDADRIQLPLYIRPWQQGDRYQPLGLKGKKLVSDLLNDQKVSLVQREQTAVLLSGNEIVWVIGRRISHAYRLTGQTRRILQISLV